MEPQKAWEPGEMPSTSVRLPGSRLTQGAAGSHYPALASEEGNQNGRGSAPATRQPVAALTLQRAGLY